MMRRALAQASTQELNPRSTAIRTGAQALVGLLVVLGPLTVALRPWLEEHRDDLPPGFYAWAVAAVTTATLISSLLGRVMAVPGVNDWLRRYLGFLSPEDGTQTAANAPTVTAAKNPPVPYQPRRALTPPEG